MFAVPIPGTQILSFAIFFLSTPRLALVCFNKANSPNPSDAFMLLEGVNIAPGRKKHIFLIVVYLGHVAS